MEKIVLCFSKTEWFQQYLFDSNLLLEIQRLLPLDKNIGIYTITIGNNAGGIYTTNNNITIGTGNNTGSYTTNNNIFIGTGSYTTNNNIAIGNNACSYTANNITIGYNADTTTTGSYTANIHSYNADSYTTNLGNYRHYNTYIHG